LWNLTTTNSAITLSGRNAARASCPPYLLCTIHQVGLGERATLTPDEQKAKVNRFRHQDEALAVASQGKRLMLTVRNRFAAFNRYHLNSNKRLGSLEIRSPQRILQFPFYPNSIR